MSELERVGRLPVFVDEDQWARAFKAAKDQVDFLYASGLIDVPSGPVNGRLHDVAVRIATAALRAAAQDDEGDIGDVFGVHIDEIRNHQRQPQPPRSITHAALPVPPSSSGEDEKS